ncbi:MAG: hypothetical protein GYB32_13060 [Algicola sp.]|nr:hypothetical protein [Algicola sp.]
MKKLITTLVLLLCVFINSCKEDDSIKLDDLPHVELTFSELSEEVKNTFENVSFIVNRNDTLINLNKKNTKVSLKNTSLVDSHFELIKEGFNHIFIIDSVKLKLKANKGDPFILYDKNLYYTEELNLREYNYKKSKYYKIDLSDVLKK